MHLTSEEKQIVAGVKYQPAVSLILSFEPAIGLRAEAQYKLKIAAGNVKRQLQESYPENIWAPVLAKLEKAIASIDYDAVKKSVAIYVSPVVSKTFYLDIEVEDKVTIDESFEIRDLIYAKQEPLKYLIFLVTGRNAKLFMADNGQLIRIMLSVPDTQDAYENDIAERVTNFSDPAKRKEHLQDKYLRSIDSALSQVLVQYKLPVFLVGVDRLLGHYKSISANAKSITDTIHGNYDEATIAELQEVVKPYAAALKQQRNARLMEEIEKAMNANKLDMGVSLVWKTAHDKQGRLLIVEKNFVYPADKAAEGEHIYPHDETTESAFFIKDAVDDIIEQVLEHGGDVVFVDEGMLAEYGRIALIRYY